MSVRKKFPGHLKLFQEFRATQAETFEDFWRFSRNFQCRTTSKVVRIFYTIELFENLLIVWRRIREILAARRRGWHRRKKFKILNAISKEKWENISYPVVHWRVILQPRGVISSQREVSGSTLRSLAYVPVYSPAIDDPPLKGSLHQRVRELLTITLPRILHEPPDNAAGTGTWTETLHTCTHDRLWEQRGVLVQSVESVAVVQQDFPTVDPVRINLAPEFNFHYAFHKRHQTFAAI